MGLSINFRGVYLVGLLLYTDQKENKIFLIYKEIQMGSGASAKSYMRKGFLIYSEEMRKYFTIYEDAVSHI